jgi:UDP-N-acetylmuramoyl-L-alanyl-D-glutamate--2,6-diaminopimelate ligase
VGDWTVDHVTLDDSGRFQFQLHGPDDFVSELDIGLPGRFNIANAALAAAMLHRAGVPPDAVADGLSTCPGVPGRMERVPNQLGVLALVDYAHTPDALAAVLTDLRADCSGQLLLVVGCGGDRDSTKRAPMGEVAARLADIVVVTDDNPRSEDPAQIRRQIVDGSLVVNPQDRAMVSEVAGRAAAIEAAVNSSRSGDVLVVAGKGHETGQEVPGGVEPFDDRVELARLVRKRARSAS